MTDFEKETPDYYRNILTSPLIGIENRVRLDFTFTYADGGTFTMTNETDGLVYNGTFGLVYDQGFCQLGLNAIDFYIEQDNGAKGKWNDTFENQIQYFTKEFKGFPEFKNK